MSKCIDEKVKRVHYFTWESGNFETVTEQKKALEYFIKQTLQDCQKQTRAEIVEMIEKETEEQAISYRVVVEDIISKIKQV